MNRNGFALLEVLVALGIAAIFLAGAIGFLLLADKSSEEAILRQEANWYGQEGIEAVKTVAFSDLILTDEGQIYWNAPEWSVVDAGGEVLANEMMRTLKVEEVRRDAQCEMTTDPSADVDPDSYLVTSQVDWVGATGSERTLSFTTVITNWENPLGDCFGAMVGCADIDISTAEWFGGKQLREIYITNRCPQDIVFDTVTLTWDNAESIDQFFMSSTKVWSSSGPGTPSGSQYSGVTLDIEDFIIAGGDTVELQKEQFSGPMSGTTLTMDFLFLDGSAYTSGEFTPLY